MNSRAFTLIELIVYMCILSFFSLFIFEYWCAIQKSTSVKVDIPSISYDVLRRDIAQASCSSHEWGALSNELVFKKKRLNIDGTLTTFDVGWKCDKGRLVRSNGVYDFLAGRWIEKRSAVVGVTDVFLYKLHAVENGYIEAVTITSENGEHTYAVRNRVVT